MAETASTPRRRGRPRKTQRGDTRERIADAAAAEFAEKGYEAASIRGIARRAGVDSALVHHYFDTKAALFAEVVKLPVRPDRVVRQALEAPIERLGESIATTVLTAWESPAVKPVGITILRSAIGSSAAGGLIRQYLLRELMSAIAGKLEDAGIPRPEAVLRAEFVLTQIAGVLILRHVLAAEPLASLPVGDVIARVTPALQGHIDGLG
ncbi:TetR family transcriptional regulator [Paramicrobacterium sp. CJ85]|uniref:TetR/AcrR family transcriptional regulator n=1 Tax=Paramicrobacterium sp. CJ85 TaxID=3445355 RepID=UPI003F60597C